MPPKHVFMGMPPNPNDPARVMQIIKDTYLAGIDAGRAVRDAEALREGEIAYGAGFKNGFDEGQKRSSETMAKMADELLTLRQKRRTKKDTGKRTRKK